MLVWGVLLFWIDRSKLPQTTRDAMAVVEAIGERYLWVDALCIVQDNKKELNDTLMYRGRFMRTRYLP